jgi:hypothetical protein
MARLSAGLARLWLDTGRRDNLKPTSRQITDYDRAMQLTILMDEDDRKLVWAVAHSAAFKARGAPWTRLARMLQLGTDGRVVKRRYMDALCGCTIGQGRIGMRSDAT